MNETFGIEKAFVVFWNVKTLLQCFGKLAFTVPSVRMGNLDYLYGGGKKEYNKINNLLTNTKILLGNFPESCYRK